MDAKPIVFLVIFVLAVAFFVYSSYKRFGLILKGRPENRTDHFFKRFWNMIYYAFFQKRVVSKPFGVNHFVLFWAFMLLLISNTP